MKTIFENAYFWQGAFFTLLLLLFTMLIISLLNKGEGRLYYQRYRLVIAIFDNDLEWFKKIVIESPRCVFDDYSIKMASADFIQKQVNKENEFEFIDFFLLDPDKHEVFLLALSRLETNFWSEVYFRDVLSGGERFYMLNNFFDCFDQKSAKKIWSEILEKLEEALGDYQADKCCCQSADIATEKDRIRALLKN